MKGIVAIFAFLAIYAGALLWKGQIVDKKKAMSFPSIYELHKENGVPIFTEKVARDQFQQLMTLTGSFSGNVFVTSVTPQDLAKVRVGQDAIIEIGENKERLNGVVSKVSAQPNLLTGLNDVEIKFPRHKALKGFYTVDVTYNSKKNSVIVVRDSVSLREERPFVYVLEGNLLRKQVVELGESNSIHYEILAGLRGGEEIVSSDSRNLSDGLKVKVVNELRENL